MMANRAHKRLQALAVHPHRYAPRWMMLLACLLSAGGCASGRSGRDRENPPPLVDQHQRIDVQLALGRTFESQTKWDAARTVYTEILRSDPQHAEAAHRLAIVYSLRGDAHSSMRWFQRAAQLAPDNADVLCDHGYRLYEEGHLADAEAKLREALAVDPQHERSRNHLGLVLACTDRRDQALAEFEKAGCTRSEAHANLVYALVHGEQFERAAAEWEVARRLPVGSSEQQRRLDAIAGLIKSGSNSAPAGMVQQPLGGDVFFPGSEIPTPAEIRSASASTPIRSTSLR